MEKLVEKVSQIKGIRSVRKVGEGQFKIKLYCKEIKGSNFVRIKGDLRSISQKVSNKLDSLEGVNSWEWTDKPRKKYTKSGISNSVTDNKSKGYKPGYYLVTIR